ncbi:hypothetical protein [Longimicrobium terrae]|uniref:Uncharacterized protein n=1 Tax=Longimicrobium terrae TaxID=1639882 RepID=A0A841GKM4_9BACT|nr:hypothetical protein [Longimicrobium terrae]MBB4634886.1 hypothetical protein [Longimicrobium terrae]MBB6069281.1 hypothetical protein [Longimicrobium terrae]NNC31910.1 hypothetical protein [Longimicrobium terrae]
MGAPQGVVPFRWNVARREQLGRLLDREPATPAYMADEPFESHFPELRSLVVRTVARAGDARLLFVGRSPEDLFDYLSGALAETAWAERIDLLSLSLDRTSMDYASAAAKEALREHFTALSLHPEEIARAPRPIAFVDLVASGRTFGALSDLLVAWAREVRVDPAAVRRRLRWVGITAAGRNSPNAWRWFQRVPWAAEYPRSALRGVSVPFWMWTHLGDSQAKTTASHMVFRWGAQDALRPSHDTEALYALRRAVRIYETARTPEERKRFAAGLAARPEMREGWLRSLVLQLR